MCALRPSRCRIIMSLTYFSLNVQRPMILDWGVMSLLVTVTQIKIEGCIGFSIQIHFYTFHAEISILRPRRSL